MRVIVTGAGGFVAPYLLRYIQKMAPEAQLFGSIFSVDYDAVEGVTYETLDLTHYDNVRAWFAEIKPDMVYHLAGLSAPSMALEAVWQTFEINTRLQLNLFQACLDLGIKPLFVAITSGDIYTGGAAVQHRMPVDETASLCPSNPYALSKAMQDLMGLQYFISHKLPVIRVRPFNHTGPGQRESFVAPEFAYQIAKIEAGIQPPIMRVGNLDAARDFTDVRDVVRAYYLLSQHGEPGQAYNVASNKTYSIQSLLDTLLSYAKTEITVEVDPAKFRPVDVPLIQGDNTRLAQLTGWQPQIPFDQTLHDLLMDCRDRVHNNKE